MIILWVLLAVVGVFLISALTFCLMFGRVMAACIRRLRSIDPEAADVMQTVMTTFASWEGGYSHRK